MTALRGRLPPVSVARHGLLLALLTAGCAPAAPANPKTVEPDWNAQVSAVRSGDSREIVVKKSAVSAAELGMLADGCGRLETLEIDHCELDRAAAEAVGSLNDLRKLKLGGPVDDETLQHIVRAENLTTLNLPEGRFSDSGLEAVSSLPRLQLLRFHSPHVTDDGLRHLAGMRSLRFLHVIDTPVTDAGLRHLHRMTWLESFYLDGGECSEAGLYELLRQLPRLHFHRDQLHLPEDPRAHPHD